MMEKMRNKKKKGFTLIELIVVIVILGILADKNSGEMIEVLLKNPKASIILTGFDGPRQVASPKKLHENHPRTIEIDDWKEALEAALMQKSDLILASGSLYSGS